MVPNTYTVTFANQRVWEFYDTHRGVDVESVNVCVVDMLEKLFGASQNSTTSILDCIAKMRSQMDLLGESVVRASGESAAEFRKEHREDMQLLLSGYAALPPMIERSGDMLRDKIQILVGDTQDTAVRDISGRLREFRESLATDVRALSGGAISNEALEKFASGIDDKFYRALAHQQTLFNSEMASSERRIADEVRGMAASGAAEQAAMRGSVGELLRKFENSSSKGRMSENVLLGALQRLYPSAQLEYVGATKESGDIVLARRGKSTILFENKCYDSTVGKAEVDKFYRDVCAQKCCGILLSQKSGVAHRENFEIELCGGKTVLFMHFVEYCPDKIRAAVDMVDHFQAKLDELAVSSSAETSRDVRVAVDEMSEINAGYREFAESRLAHIRCIKECHQKLVAQAEAMAIPAIDRLLERVFTTSIVSREDTTCVYCGYVAKSKGGLRTHLRSCAVPK
jgi:hypothetical protein